MFDEVRNDDTAVNQPDQVQDIQAEEALEGKNDASEAPCSAEGNRDASAADEVPEAPFSKYEDESPWANQETWDGEESDDCAGPDEEDDDRAYLNDPNWNKMLGARGEEAAARFLERKGFDIVARNWTCDIGEVDIIAEDEFSLHFVEVKTRSDVNKGFPAEAVDSVKRRKYEMMAMIYLMKYDRTDVAICFDIISIVVTGENTAMLRYHANAFSHNGL